MRIFVIISILLIAGLFASNAYSDTTNTRGVTTEETYKNLYTPLQDSAYQAAMKYNVPFSIRFYNDLMRSDEIWKLWTKQNDITPWNYLKHIFESMPEDVFLPEGTEIVQRQINIQNALSVPGAKPFGPNVGITVNDPWGKLGRLLGIVEDLSPEIKYNLSVTADVDIVIYSVQAIIVAKIFSGTQKPGEYKITWNGRDDQGKKMPSGDYVAEVRIGNDRFVRKRIVIE